MGPSLAIVQVGGGDQAKRPKRWQCSADPRLIGRGGIRLGSDQRSPGHESRKAPPSTPDSDEAGPRASGGRPGGQTNVTRHRRVQPCAGDYTGTVGRHSGIFMAVVLMVMGAILSRRNRRDNWNRASVNPVSRIGRDALFAAPWARPTGQAGQAPPQTNATRGARFRR